MSTIVKVLQIGMTENLGGMETYLMNQYRHLDRNKIRYDFVNITADRPMVFEDEIADNGDCVYKICRRSKNPLKHYYEWWRLLKKQKDKYDAIVLNACHLYYVFPLVIGKMMGIETRLIHSHNSGNELHMGFLRKFIVWLNRKLLYWSATDYWACSDVAGRWMFDDKGFSIIHNATDTDKFIFNSNIRIKKQKEVGLNEKVVLGHVGRFSYQKNHEFLINIFSEVFKKNNNAVLLLVGDAVGDDQIYLKRAHEKVCEFGLQDHVRFLGMRTDVNELMQAMDCFILPSRFEGLPNVGIEAQAAGLPCFFADTITSESGITDLTHFISLDSSPEEWAEKITTTIPVKRKDMSKEIIGAGYDIKEQTKHIETFYLGLLGQ